MVLDQDDGSFRVLTEVTVQLPIRRLDSSSNGLPDIGVWVRGGGIQPGYEARLRFDGTKYPNNTTVHPATRVFGAKGAVVISHGGLNGLEGERLY